MLNNKQKNCPLCCESIKSEAIKCKHCHSLLDKKIVSIERTAINEASNSSCNENKFELKTCNACGKRIPIKAIKCMYCEVLLDQQENETKHKRPFVVYLIAGFLFVFCLRVVIGAIEHMLLYLQSPWPNFLFLSIFLFVIAVLLALVGIGLLLGKKAAYVASIVMISIFLIFSIVVSVQTMEAAFLPVAIIVTPLIYLLLRHNIREYFGFVRKSA